MSEYIFRDAPGFGCDMDGLMDDGRTPIREYFASNNIDHYGTVHEEIVRCRDCEHYEQETVIDGETVGSWCDWMCMSRPQPDGFCAWGVRREP